MDFETPEPPPSSAAYPSPYGPPVTVADLEAPIPPRRRHRGRWIAALAVVVAVVGAAVAATGRSTPKSPVAVLADASGQTTGSGSAHVSMTERISSDGIDADILDVAGDTDWAHKTSALTLSTRGRTVLAIRQVATVTYMSSPFASLPGGAHWVSIHASDLPVGAAAATVGSNDPSQGLKYLSAIKGDPKEVGHETVDGVDTTHYTFTVDMKSFLEAAAKAQKALGMPSTGAALGQLPGVDLSKVPAAAWIDHQGRVRKFTVALDASAGGTTATVVDTFSFSRFDEPVSTSAPAPSDTAPFSEFRNFMAQLSTGGTAVSS